MTGGGILPGTIAVMVGTTPGIMAVGAGTIPGTMAIGGILLGTPPGILLITMAGMTPGITAIAGMVQVIMAGMVSVVSDAIM